MAEKNLIEEFSKLLSLKKQDHDKNIEHGYQINHTISNVYSMSQDDIRSIIYDAYQQCLIGNISPTKLCACLHQYFDNNVDINCYCVNLLATLDIQCNVNKELSRSKYIQLLKASLQFIPEHLFKEFIEPETLEECGVIKSFKMFNQKLIRLKTKLFYKQKKYNLLREENEGYTKLMLHFRTIEQLEKVKYTKENVNEFVDNVISIIGYFSLDPYRVLDLMLDFFEDFNPPLPNAIIKNLMDQTGELSICEIISFKLLNIKSMSLKFFDQIVSLINCDDIVQLNQIYSYLLPSDEELCLKVKLIEKNEEDETKRISASSLQESTKLSKQHYKPLRFADCSKISLLAAFIRAVDMKGIDFYLQRFPTNLLLSFPQVIKSLFTSLHLMIEPLYSKLSSRLLNKIEEPHNQWVCDNFSDLNPVVFKYIKIIGHNLHEDPILFIKLIRLFSAVIKEYYSNEPVYKTTMHDIWCGVMMCISCSLFPSLSFMESNCVASSELWLVIRQFPYTIRYRLYNQIKTEAYSTIKPLTNWRIIFSKNTKFICKRITKDNVKQCGRQIGKLTHSNPIVVISEIINQICTFDSMINPIVDCLKYLSQLSYDILIYSVIEVLSIHSITLTSQITSIPDIIQNLGVFAATIMRKYSVSLTGILQYIANQLKDGNPLDLIVLREVLHKMAGIQEQHLTTQQIQALAGSEALRDEVGVGISFKSHKKSALHVTEALIDADLTFPLFFLIAQQRDRFMYDTSLNEMHIKLVGALYDQCHQTLVQYGRFISKYIPISDFTKNIPLSFSILHKEYGLNLETMFFLIRHIFRSDFMKTPKNSLFNLALNGLLDQYLTSINQYIPIKVSYHLPCQLICIFWMLDLYDIYHPESKYDENIQKFTQLLTSLDEVKEYTNSQSNKKLKEKERLTNVLKTITDDREYQKTHILYVKNWLAEILSTSFTSIVSKGEAMTYFYQYCIYSRCIFSAVDAVYSAKFIFILHQLNLQHFSSLTCFDKVLGDNFQIISSLSEHEANNYGMFLNCFMQLLYPWHASRQLYEQSCYSHPGFLSFIKSTTSDSDKADPLEYENFRHLMYKWHYKLTRSFVICLESKDYVQLRNAIIILTQMGATFPRISTFKNAILKRVEKLGEEEKDKRADIYTLVTCYGGLLKNMKESIVEEAEFHYKESTKEEKPGVNAENLTPTTRLPIVQTPKDGTALNIATSVKPEEKEQVKRIENKQTESKYIPSKQESSTEVEEIKRKKSIERVIIPDQDNNIPYNGTEKTYSLRNHERKRQPTDDLDESKNKRRKDLDSESRSISGLNDRGQITSPRAESSSSLPALAKKHSTITHDAFSVIESRDRVNSKPSADSSHHTRRKSRESSDWSKSTKREDKKRKI